MKNFVITLPGIITVLMPKCSMCVAAYAGLLSVAGIGLMDYSAYLLPLSILFLTLSLAALVFRAKQRWGYKPFLLGLAAVFLMMLGRFQMDSSFVLYLGIFLLLAASLWNGWPRKNLCATNHCSS